MGTSRSSSLEPPMPAHIAARDHPERRRALFRLFMQTHEIETPAQWARDAGLRSANAVYNFLNGHADSLNFSTLQKLVACVPGASVEELFEGAPRSARRVRMLRIRSRAARDLWCPYLDDTEGWVEDVELPVPIGVTAQMGVQIVDHHASGFGLPRGAYVLVAPTFLDERPLAMWDFVLVRRVRPATYETEHTIGRISPRDREEHPALEYADPARPNEAALPLPCWPHDGRVVNFGDYRLEIVGRVTGVYIDPATLGPEIPASKAGASSS